MWQEVGVAALVGLALSDSWLCLFMGATFAAADRRMSWGFMTGRTLGVVALLLAIGLLGASLLPSKEWLTVAFAASTVAVAVVLALSVYRPGLLGGCSHGTQVACDGGEPDGGSGCTEDCQGCAAAGEDGGFTCGHLPRGLVDRLSGRSPWTAGLALGACRGAMPCLKVLIITPLLIASPPATVVMMVVAFAITSMVYPLIGLLSGSALSSLSGQGRRLRLVGAAGVATVGIITLVRFYQRTCDGLGA